MQDVYDSYTFVASTPRYLLASHPLSEFTDQYGVVQCAFNASAAGINLSIWTGNFQVYNALVPLVKATSPIFPDDYTFSFPIGPGMRLVIYGTVDATTPVLLWAMRFFPAA